MNDQVLAEMRIIVERVARPLRVSDARRLRMREELLDHLTAIYQEEFDRLGNETVALERARERFGIPGELTEEFGRSISRMEYVRYLLDRYRYRPGESLSGLAWRHLLLSLVAMAGMLVVMLPLIWMRGRPGEIGVIVQIASVTALFSAGFSFSFALLAEQMGQVLYGRGSPHPRRAMVQYVLLSFPVFPLLTALVYGGLGLGFNSMLRGLLFGCTVAPVAPLLFYMMARQMKKQIRRESDWLALEIDG